MKNASLVIICIMLLPNWYIAQETPRLELPSAITSDLDKRFSGWRFPAVSDEVRKFVKEYFSPETRPEFTSGDFDGNGQTDYAMLVEHGKIFDMKGKVVGQKVQLVAYLKKRGKYKFYMVDPEGGGEYLFLMRKGEKDYNYQTQKEFIYEKDAISAGIFEKAGTSYIYEKGKFRAIITGD